MMQMTFIKIWRSKENEKYTVVCVRALWNEV